MSKKHVPAEEGRLVKHLDEEHNIEGHEINKEIYTCPGEYDCYLCGMDSMIHRFHEKLLGRLLTVVDSLITDDRQNKASKDVVRDVLWTAFFQEWNCLSRDARNIVGNALTNSNIKPL